jgi:uncharacterized membrane protein HdeD (DUF308 family)
MGAAILKYAPILCGVILIIGAFVPRPRDDMRWASRFLGVILGIACLYFAIHRIIHY